GHRREPDQPVQPKMVRAQEAWPPVGIPWLAFELIRPPLSILGWRVGQRAFENDFVSDPADTAERSVRIHQLERLKGSVHPLPTRKQICNRLNAQGTDSDCKNGSRDSLRSRRRSLARLPQKVLPPPLRHEVRKEFIIETGNDWNECQPIQE